MTFSRLARIVGNLLFFVYWFLDEVRSIKEVQKTSKPFWIYLSIFTQPIWFILVFLFFNFHCNTYVTNPIIDVYKVNNGRHYQCQSNVWADMGIMRWRSIFKDINQLLYGLLPDFHILTAIYKKRWLNIPIKTIKYSQSDYTISHISIIAGSAA